LILIDCGAPKHGGGAVTVDELRGELVRIGRSGESTPEENAAAERLIATIDSGSGSHLKRQALDELVTELMKQPAAVKAATRIESMARGRAVRVKSTDELKAKAQGNWEKVAGNVHHGAAKQHALPDVLEWHRGDKRLNNVVIKTILAKVSKEQPYGRLRVASLQQLRISDEPVSTPSSADLGVHIPTEYRHLAPTAKGATEWSLFEELASRFAAAGLSVYSKPHEDTPTVLMLSPELYNRPELCLELSKHIPDTDQLVATDNVKKRNRGSVMGRASIMGGGGGGRASISGGRRGSNLLLQLDQPALTLTQAVSEAEMQESRWLPKFSCFGRRKGEDQKAKDDDVHAVDMISTAGGAAFVPLFSTQSTLSWYANTCPTTLADGALTSLKFDKWPASRDLQEAMVFSIANEMKKKHIEGTLKSKPASPAPKGSTEASKYSDAPTDGGINREEWGAGSGERRPSHQDEIPELSKPPSHRAFGMTDLPSHRGVEAEAGAEPVADVEAGAPADSADGAAGSKAGSPSSTGRSSNSGSNRKGSARGGMRGWSSSKKDKDTAEPAATAATSGRAAADTEMRVDEFTSHKDILPIVDESGEGAPASAPAAAKPKGPERRLSA